MEELLKKQSEHLARIVDLLETDRLMQAAQTYEAHKSLRDEDHISKKLDDISATINSFVEANKISTEDAHALADTNHEDNDGIVDAIKNLTEETKKSSKSSSKDHLAALKKIQETLKQNTEYKGIAETAKGTPIFKSFKDDFRDIKESFADKKKSFTESIKPKNILQGIASSISPRYKDRLEYIKNEQNLGSKKTEKTLKKDYDTRSQMLQRNVKNEALLEKTRGSLTEEEFLKGDTKIARQYLKEKEAVGKGLKKTDSRYSLDEKVAKREERASARLANKFKGNTEAIQTVATQQAAAIAPMGTINLDTSVPRALESRTPVAPVAQVAPATPKSAKEDLLESNRTTKDYQTVQLTNAKEQKDILTDQLKTQEEILKIITEINDKPAETTSDGGGIADTLGTVAGAVAGGGALAKMGSIATAAAVPLAVGVAGAAVLNYAANTYSDSFGEGGFDLVKKLHDDKVIDYNATVMGYNPSEILDWKAIEALPPKDLKTLMDSGVEFSREDTSKLHELYNKEMIASGGSEAAAKATPEATKAEGEIPSDKRDSAKDTNIGPITAPKQETGTPEATKAEDVAPITTREESHIHKVNGKIVESTKTINGEDSGVQIKPEAITPEATKVESDTTEATKAEPVKPYSKLTAEEITSARDEKDIADLENKADQLDKAGVTSGKFEAGQLVIPEANKAEAVTPEAVRPTQAESIYNKSGENAGVAAAGSTSPNNIVNAPTINNNSNTTQNNIVKLPVRNQDNTINRYVSSRYSNQ